MSSMFDKFKQKALKPLDVTSQLEKYGFHVKVAGGGKQGQADAVPPRIVSGPTVVEVGNNSATIEWETDELADSFVDYDTKPYLGQVVGSPGLSRNHRVVLTDLTPGTRYFFKAGSRDASGNGPTESRAQIGRAHV